GDLPAFILTWMLLSLPLVYLFNASTPAALYLAGIAAWTGNVMHEGSQKLCFWALLILFIPHYATAMIRDAGGFRATALSWALLACMSVATGLSIEGVMPGIWIVVYASLMTSIYLVGTLWFDDAPSAWRRPFQTIGQRGIVVLSFILTFREPWRHIGWHYYGARGYQTTFGAAADYAMTISLTILAVSLLLRCVRNGKTPSLFLGVMPALAIVG
ncbi:MAG: hypothetical protein HZB26_23580, partial [Candidatus Hydrogenedentes bacterium]|nr:hypothetical protein [Candidatus Hydrogenedentota bacterium]